MLCLSRKLGESIMVGNCQIKVISLSDGKVRLAFDAPREVPIYRLELQDKYCCKEDTNVADLSGM